ncbi:FG-GAP repeat protein, partial [Patescibacteria group bacterium]|nr:FG-GAP repeat protein [Patescibacteria group bacterium]
MTDTFKKITSLLLFALLAIILVMPDSPFTKAAVGTRTETQKVDSGALLDFFAGSTDVDGTLAITGAIGVGANDTGEAYIYEYSGGTWGLIKTLTGDGTDYEFFGSSVAIDGNYAVVGARGNDTLADDAGAVFIFEKDYGGADNWGLRAKKTASNGTSEDGFGGSVDISGDYIIASAPSHYFFDPVPNTGQAYILKKD